MNTIKHIIIVCLLFSFSQCQSKETNKQQGEQYKILSIDTTALKFYNKFILVEINSSKDTIILLSNKNNTNSQGELIKQGSIYEFDLSRIYEVKLTGENKPVMRLYQHDIYTNEKLVFPKNIKVYTSKNIQGLYFSTSGK